MKVSEFTGGLNTKIDSSLLPSNSAVTLVNADIASGVLKAMSNVSDDAKYSGVLNQFIQHKGNVISSAEAAVGYTEYANDLYYTEGGVLKQLRSATEYTVGLAKPSSALTLGGSDIPDIPTSATPANDDGSEELDRMVEGGDLLPSVAYTYLRVHKDHNGEVFRRYIASATIFPTYSAIEFEYFGPSGFTVELYRLYSGTYRLVGSGSLDFATPLTILDNVLDISGNTAIAFTTTLTNSLSNNNEYFYELYDTVDFLGTTVYSDPLDVSQIYTYADILILEYGTIVTPRTDADHVLVRVHIDTTTKEEIRYIIPYVSGESAWVDYMNDPIDSTSYSVLDLPARLNGTYQYVSTFYNSVNGYESQPSSVSAEKVVVNGIINVSNILSNSAATHVRIYRVGGALTQFTRVVEIANGTTSYIDEESDIDIDGTLLVSEDYNVPSNNMTLLAESNGVLFGAIGSKLVFSKQGLVFAWPLENFIEFKNEITCIQEAANGVIVCTETETFVITGNSPKSFSKYPVSGEHGCLFNTSFQKLRNGVIFKSATALVFTSGGEVTVLTEKFFSSLDISVLGSAVHNNTYYAMSATDIFVYNLTDGNYYTIGLAASNLGIVDNKVHALIGTELHSLGEGSTLATLQYKSPLFTDGNHSELKSYKNVYFAVKGTFTLKIYLDEVLEVTREVVTTKIEAIDVKVPQLKQKAVNIQIEISGTGTVYEYEWKSLGRQNGR